MISLYNFHYVLILIWLIIIITSLFLSFIFWQTNVDAPTTDMRSESFEEGYFGDLDFDNEDTIDDSYIDPETGLDKDFGDLFAPVLK